MIIYKIEVHDPVVGYAYGRQTFATIDAAKRWLSNLLQDLRESGMIVREEEGEGMYEIAFSIGGMYYRYRVLSEYAIC